MSALRIGVMVAMIASCNAPSNEPTRAAVALETSPVARARVTALRERFLMSGVKARPREKGKDVVWVPTADIMVEVMLELANVTAKDRLVDLGSGDGRLVIGAAKRGARALGIEYDPQLVALSKVVAEKERVTAKARFEKADLFETDFSDATVVTLFLLPEMNLRLQPKLFDLRPGTRIVANTFPVGEWKADEAVTAKDDCAPFCTAALFVVPAKVAGTWKQEGAQLELEQEFQFVTGTWSEGGVETPVVGRLRGDAFSLVVGATRYSGRVTGTAMEGSDGQKRLSMTLVRAAAPKSPSKPQRTPVIGTGTASFVASGTDSVRALVPRERARTATVEVPRSAAGFVRLEDEASRLSVGFALRDAQDVPVAVADGMALYAGALGGADLLHRPHAQGIEHFVVLEKRPAKEEMSYLVDVSRVAGLRLVAGTLELLDRTGAPRLRMAAPYVVDAAGTRHNTQLAVEGCRYDKSPVAPWGRAVTKPGDPSCSVRVSWQSVVYPAIVAPNWTTTFPMVEARRMHTASVLASGQVLIAGGASPMAELYDPATGTFAATGSMIEGRSEHTASVLASGRVLVVGGNRGGTTPPYRLASAEIYDPATGAFSSTGSMSSPRSHHTATVLDSNRVLVAGGTNDVESLATAELFDAGAFSAVGSMGGARAYHTATVLSSGKVLVAGGVGPARAELYDPATRAFSSTGAMAQPRANHTATLLPTGEVLIVGGASAELYDPVAGEFSAAGSLAQPRARHTANVLASGKVLVAGGFRKLGAFDSAELYDPVARRFSKANAMTSTRYAHTATLLPSGDVLMTGADDPTAELYDIDGGPHR